MSRSIVNEPISLDVITQHILLVYKGPSISTAGKVTCTKYLCSAADTTCGGCSPKAVCSLELRVRVSCPLLLQYECSVLCNHAN